MSRASQQGQKRTASEAGLDSYSPSVLPLKKAIALLKRYFSSDPLCGKRQHRESDGDSKDGKDAKSSEDSDRDSDKDESEFVGMLDPRLLPALMELPASLLDIVIAVTSPKAKHPLSLGVGNWFRLLDALHTIASSRKVAEHQDGCLCELANSYQPTIDDSAVERDLGRLGFVASLRCSFCHQAFCRSYYAIAPSKQRKKSQFQCGVLNPLLYAIYGGVFFPAHMPLSDLTRGEFACWRAEPNLMIPLLCCSDQV